MKKKSSIIIGVLGLALPIIHFFCQSQLFVRSLLFLLSSLSFFLLTTSGCLNNTNQKSRIILLPIILISLIITGIFINTLSAYRLLNHLALFVLFAFFITTINNFSNSFITKCIFFIVILEIALLLTSFFNTSVVFYPNNSILSILLSSQFAFLAPQAKSFIQSRIVKKTNRLFLLFSVVIFCYSVLYFTHGRTGIVSFSLTLFLLNINLFRKVSLWKKVVTISAIFILLGVLFFMKLNSSNGRLLIYKIVLTSIKPVQFFTGIGYGQFKAQYNHYQSNYFSNHPINTGEAFLADNTYYAFNDPLQLILELGIIGLTILVIFAYVIRKKFISDLQNERLKNSFLFGAYLCIFSFLSSSLFSYPFQVLIILSFFLFSLAIVFGSTEKKNKLVNSIGKFDKHTLRLILLLSISALLLFFSYRSLKAHYKIKEAENLAKAGFKRKSVVMFANLSNDRFIDKNIYYPFAMELSKLNETDSAISVLKKSIKYIYNDHSALLLANLYYDKGLLSLAEHFYKESVYINPKSFRNRFALFTFYIDTKQNDKSLYWGKSIIELKPKIPSEAVMNIKIQTANTLQKIQQD
ncbi:MAG TPA: O-antigen ligase family protein [Chitinophagaceae bacterium]|nr:O-antigen ligase family protein [Chitinophagaceae bacterium]